MSAEKRVLHWLSGGPLALCLFACFTALLGAVYWLSNGGSLSRPAAAQARGVAPRGSAGAAVGTLARLQPLPGHSLWLARDGRAYELYWRARAAGDTRSAAALEQSGAVFMVDDDSEARVTAAGPGSFRVRILEGERQGHEGWLPAACLHAAEGRRDF
jgi:hypothetical protein